MKEKSILLALDGSAQCSEAMNLCFQLAKCAAVRITAQHVLDTAGLWDFLAFDKPGLIGSGPYIAAYEVMRRELKSIGETLSEALKSRAEAYKSTANSVGVMLDCVLDDGNIVQEIYGRAQNHDIVVMGHRSNDFRSPSQKQYSLANPSVAEKLLRYINRPLLIVQDTKAEWKTMTLVVSVNQAFPNSTRGCLELTEFFKIPLKVYLWVQTREEEDRLPGVLSSFRTSLGLPKDSAIDFTVVREAAHWWIPRIGIAADTIFVIPTLELENKRESVFGTPPDLVLRHCKHSAMMFWPEEFSLGSKQVSTEAKREPKTLAVD